LHATNVARDNIARDNIARVNIARRMPQSAWHLRRAIWGEVNMSRDVAELVEQYLSTDPGDWAKLASDIQWRRSQLLLLREILLELRKLNDALRERDQEQR
jgi:hypothetical protein